MPGRPPWMTASLVAHHLPHLHGPEAVVLGATTVAAAAAGAVHRRHVSEPAAPRPPAPRHGLRRRMAAVLLTFCSFVGVGTATLVVTSAPAYAGGGAWSGRR